MSQGTSTGTVGNAAGGVSGPSVGLSPYAYNQVAPLTTQQQAGQQLVSDLSQPVQNALGTAQNTNQYLSGGGVFDPNMMNWMQSGALMNPGANPYLTGMYNAAAQPVVANYQQAVAPNILQQGAQSGTLGSSGYAQNFVDAQSALGNTLGNLASNMYGNAYNTGLQATQNALGQGLGATTGAIGQTPGLAQAQYIPSQQLFGSGQLGQQQAQNILNTATGNLNQQAQWPYQALNMLTSTLGNLGGQQTVTQGKTGTAGAGK